LRSSCKRISAKPGHREGFSLFISQGKANKQKPKVARAFWLELFPVQKKGQKGRKDRNPSQTTRSRSSKPEEL
jgi:hypothetical protein